MEKYDVILFELNKAAEINAVVYAGEDDSSGEIILKITIDNNEITAKSDGYLPAYQELRDKLLEIGFGLKCCGSLINANQSAMMSYTPKIYLVEPGKQALLKNAVNIWDYRDISTFPDTAEQNRFTEKWFESLRK